MSRPQRQYIADMLEMISHAQLFAEGMTVEKLDDDLKTQLAL